MMNALKAQRSSQPWNMVPSICTRGVAKFALCGRTYKVLLERQVETSRGDLDRVFGTRAPMRILIESGPESEWVAQALEALGHEAVVADPNYAAMYGTRSRKIKTDRRDVAALAEACRTGVYRPAHRASGVTRTAAAALTRPHPLRAAAHGDDQSAAGVGAG